MKLFAAVPILFLAGSYSQDVPDPNNANCADICTGIAYYEATAEVYGCDCPHSTVPCAAYCKSIETWENAAEQKCDNGCPSGDKNGAFCQSIVASSDAANESIEQAGCGDCSNPSEFECESLCQTAEFYEKTIENDEDCSAATNTTTASPTKTTSTTTEKPTTTTNTTTLNTTTLNTTTPNTTTLSGAGRSIASGFLSAIILAMI